MRRLLSLHIPLAFTFLLVPLLMGWRSTVRGLVMRSGRTGYVTLSSLVSLGALFGVYALRPAGSLVDGGMIGFLCWMGALSIEFVVLLFGLARLGLDACVADERYAAATVTPEEAPEADALDPDEAVVRACPPAARP
jgi:hypothetical protein